MKHLVLIDTSGWTCFFSRRGYEEMKKRISTLLEEDRVAIAGPFLIELVQGTRKGFESVNFHWSQGDEIPGRQCVITIR